MTVVTGPRLFQSNIIRRMNMLSQAIMVADEQLRQWRRAGVTNEDIYRELTGSPPPWRVITRDELIASAWLGVTG